VKSCTEFINRHVSLLEKALNATKSLIIKNYLKSSKAKTIEAEAGILYSIKELFKIYYRIVLQIKIDVKYFEEGVVDLNGHLEEMNKLLTKMDRSKNISSDYRKKSNTEFDDFIKKSGTFSCVSIDGLNFLKFQIFCYLRTKKIKTTDLVKDEVLDSWISMSGLSLNSLNTLATKSNGFKQNSLHIQIVEKGRRNNADYKIHHIKVLNKV
jgi:hypothetical protein